ncbi:Ig-like domain repeat protein [Neobacillus sp. Marseille-QA0830]
MRKFLLVVCLFLFSSILATPLTYAKAEAAGPVIDSVEVTPGELSAGENITVKVKLADASTEVTKLTGFVGTPKNRGFEVHFSYNQNEDAWIGTYEIRSYEVSGEFFVQVEAEDANGNYDYADQSFVVKSNPNADLDSPVLKNIELSTSEDNSQLIVKADVLDAYSGLFSVRSWVYSPEGSIGYNIDLTYDENQGRWIGSRNVNLDRFGNIDDYVLPGEWRIELEATDEAGNTKSTETTATINGDLYKTIVYLNGAYDLFGEDSFLSTYVDKIAKTLLQEAETMNTIKARDVYQLLMDSYYTSDEVKAEAKEKLDGLKGQNVVVENADHTTFSTALLNSLNEDNPILLSKSGTQLSIPVSELKRIAANQDVQIDIHDVTANYSDALSAVLDFDILVDSKKYSGQFAEPFTVTFNVDPSKVKNWDNIELRYIDDNGKAISYKDQIVSVNKETGEVVAKIYHFSTYGIFEVASAGNGGASSTVVSTTNSSSTTLAANTVSTTAASTNTQDAGKTLPKTATNTYNLLVVGGLVVLSGLGMFFVHRRGLQFNK